MPWMYFGKCFWRIARDIVSECRTVPLADLYDGCKDNLISRGGEVRLRAPIRGLEIEGGANHGVAFESGEVLRADYLRRGSAAKCVAGIVARGSDGEHPVFENLKQLKTSPITGVHLWFDRVVMNEPFLTLVDTTTQWIFNKNVLYGGDSSGGTRMQRADNICSW